MASILGKSSSRWPTALSTGHLSAGCFLGQVEAQLSYGPAESLWYLSPAPAPQPPGSDYSSLALMHALPFRLAQGGKEREPCLTVTAALPVSPVFWW